MSNGPLSIVPDALSIVLVTGAFALIGSGALFGLVTLLRLAWPSAANGRPSASITASDNPAAPPTL